MVTQIYRKKLKEQEIINKKVNRENPQSPLQTTGYNYNKCIVEV